MQAFGVSLDRYIGKTIFTTIMMTLFMLVSLGHYQICRPAEKTGQGSYDALGAGMYTLLSVPKDVQIFFPMAACWGRCWALGCWLSVKAGGDAGIWLYPYAGCAVGNENRDPAGAVGPWRLANGSRHRGEQMARNYRAQAMYGGSLLSTQQGLWAKDGQNFVYIERVKGDDELGSVSIYAFNNDRRLQSVRYARLR